MNTARPINQNQPEISIIVTAYNVEEYIEQAVCSVIDGTSAQSHEVIVVDDGSTDGTRQIIKRIAGRFQNVRIILFKENTPGGVGRAANAGISAANGTFIGFLDGDDIALPGTYDRLLSSIKADKSDIALCDYERRQQETGVVEKSEDSYVWQSISQKTNYNGEDVKELLKLQVYPWRKLYRTSFLEEHVLRFPEVESFFEDTLFHWQICLAASSATICNFVGFHYRIDRPGQSIGMAAQTRKQALSYAPKIKELAEQSKCPKENNDAFLSWYLRVVAWVGPSTDEYQARAIQQEVLEILDGISVMRIASMLRQFPAKRGIFPPSARIFSAVIWLRLGVPYLFRKRLRKHSVTLFEALLIWGLILISPRN